MSHFIYSKEGVQLALGLSRLEDVNYYIKKALKLGVKPYKIMHHEKFYDVDILMNPRPPDKKTTTLQQLYSDEELEKFAKGQLF